MLARRSASFKWGALLTLKTVLSRLRAAVGVIGTESLLYAF